MINKDSLFNVLTAIMFILSSCKQPSGVEDMTSGSTNQAANDKEDFDSFYKKFINDNLFQMQRIHFPLPGINTDEMDINDTLYYWQKKDWRVYKGIPNNIDTSEFKITTVRMDSMAVDEVALKEGSFSVRYIFRLKKDSKWYLVRHEDINL